MQLIRNFNGSNHWDCIPLGLFYSLFYNVDLEESNPRRHCSVIAGYIWLGEPSVVKVMFRNGMHTVLHGYFHGRSKTADDYASAEMSVFCISGDTFLGDGVGNQRQI